MSAMFPDEIADYLKNNPGFFEKYADLMATIFVPHPHGGHTVSLAERQMLTRKTTRLARKCIVWRWHWSLLKLSRR